jgi:hypothetical protein
MVGGEWWLEEVASGATLGAAKVAEESRAVNPAW